MPWVKLLRGTIAICLLALAGCGGCGSVPITSVAGVVTVDDKPVAGGTIGFHPVNSDAGGQPYYGTIDDNGNYHVDNVPVGEVIVTVEGKPPEKVVGPTVAGATVRDLPEETRGKIVAGPAQGGLLNVMSGTPGPSGGTGGTATVIVPSKFKDVSTSDLKQTLVQGSNTYDIRIGR